MQHRSLLILLMIFLCTAFLTGVVLLIVSLVTLDLVGIANGLSIAIIFGTWVWFTRGDFTS